MQTAGSRRYLREFDIEELLFRKPIAVNNEKTAAYYRDKVILITGGGGSIGSELCRQLAKMEPNWNSSWQSQEEADAEKTKRKAFAYYMLLAPGENRHIEPGRNHQS